MRPLRLTMQAFGPYPDRQTVDFTDALKVGLFGLYGPTGAGKSSIFSAIAFALFGAPAKGEQDLTTLRSHHAAPDVVTEVQLVFDVGPKRYFVRRRPEQSRPKLRGDGETKEAHSAWLFDASGMSLEAISETNPGKLLAEKKVSEVAQQMQAILGYSAEHFRQIVLLPQGEFEKFLVARTEDRLKILRQLFDVSLFQTLAKKLKEDATKAAAKIGSDRLVFGRMLATEGCTSLEMLQSAGAQAQADAAALKPALARAGVAAQQAAAMLGEARQLNMRFEDLDAAGRALAELQAKNAAIEIARSTLGGARLAQGLADIDQAVETARRRLAAAEKAKGVATRTNDAAMAAAATAGLALEAEQKREDEKAALVARGNDLQRYQEILNRAEAQGNAVAAALTIADTSGGVLDKALKAQATLVKTRHDKRKELGDAEQNSQERAKLTAQVQVKDQAYKVAQQYETAVKALKDASAAEARARRAVDEARVAEAGAEKVFGVAERELSEVQAVHLAKKLADGEPCPVCGSDEHPNPATGDPSSVGRNDAFVAAKKDLETARRTHGAAREKLAAAGALAMVCKTTLDALPAPSAPAVQIAGDLKTLKERLTALGADPDIQAIKDAIAKTEKQLEAAAETCETARTDNDKAKTQLALAQQALESALAGIPADLRTAEAIATAIAATDKAISQLQAALTTAATKEREAREAAITAAAELANADRAVAEAGKELQEDESAFATRLAAVGLDAEQYREHKANIGRIQALQQEIEAHGQKLAAATAQLDQAKRHVEDLERPDLPVLQEAHDACVRNRDDIAIKEADARNRAVRLADLHARLSADRSGIDEAEEAYKPLGAVAAALNGDNASRVDIEAFAMASMFDRVLEHANLRLGPMTGGRYSLQRGFEGRGGGRRGLDVVVHDLFTGRPRPPSTLSGGETFQAALALALGLSDVVESMSGGIKLDMIFIDEGFGSLDGQTLDEALQTLQDLVGQSRALGLISHIEAVQQAIPHGFQIEKTMTGSTIRQRHP